MAGFQTSDVTAIRQKWVEEGLGSIQEFWMMLGAESFSKHPQPVKKSIATSVLERGRFQKAMREQNNG